MRILAVVACLASAATAQQLLVFGQNALPACAQQCTLLQSAQDGCLPPAAPVTDAVTYESCFCQSGYLTTLKTTASTVCSDVCEAADVGQISSWYQSNCADNGVAAAAAVSSGTSTAASTVASSTSAASATGTRSTQATASTSDDDAPHDWWTDHWKWIVMLIVVFVGLAILTVILVLVRRRYHRRQDLATAPFNSGITRHSLPVLSVTPPPHSKQASNQTSRTSLPRVREKDRVAVNDVPVPPVPPVPDMTERSMRERGGTPDTEHAHPRGGNYT